MRRPETFAGIGPEVLAAASDNDPTNVGTAALVGAQTGYQLSWVALLTAPLLGVVLSIAAQVGMVARSDLQSLVLKRYGRKVSVLLLVSVVLVNLVTIAADLQAGAVGIGILAGVGSGWVILPFGLALVGLLLIGKYDEIVAVLRYLLIGFLAFAAAAILAKPDWSQVINGSFLPTMTLRPDQLAGALALVGTTLTAYVYFWETIARGVEEPADHRPRSKDLARVRLGAVVGAIFTAVILWFMLVAFAATLGQQHRPVATAQDAASALRPLAGSLASGFFAAGLAVSAVVALPVLMATTAHVIGAEFDWRRGLSQEVRHAWRFYAILAVSIALGVAVDVAGVPLIDMLVAASVIGGLGTPVGVFLLVCLGRDTRVMGDQRISSGLAIAGRTVAAVVGGLGLLYVIWAARGQF
jgi:NRAMP (natural resistance-associated macrophage protein)-like metal ion transporter